MIDVAVVPPINGCVDETIGVVSDTAVLTGGLGEVFETSTLTEVFVISIPGKDVLLTDNTEMVRESAIVVTSFFAVVIMAPKLVAAVVDTVIPVVEDDRVVDISVGESLKSVEEVIAMTMGLLAAVDNEDIERVLELVGFIMASNVVIRVDNLEGVKSAKGLTDAVKLDLIAVATNFVLMVEFLIR